MNYEKAEREAKAIRKDIATAQAIIRDGILRYKKKMLKARSKAKADSPDIFKDLEPYKSKTEIQDAFGWEIISLTEMERLLTLWDARERHMTAQGRYEDRVTLILEYALNRCIDRYTEQLEDFEELQRQRRLESS